MDIDTKQIFRFFVFTCTQWIQQNNKAKIEQNSEWAEHIILRNLNLLLC